MRRLFLCLLCSVFMLGGCTKDAEKTDGGNGSGTEEPTPPEPEQPVSAFPSSLWTARYAPGKSLDGSYPEPRANRTVGIFYFLWHGAHGYDLHTADGNQVIPPTAADTKSPYDINELLKLNPDDPQYGPVGAFHHWGKPYLDYYVANDEWVLRKHAQMLSDIGVDVIILDVTNGFHYLPTVDILCRVYMEMRAEGNRTPQLCFLSWSAPQSVVGTLYRDFYKGKSQYADLWFRWKGKPLLLCPDDVSYPAEIANFFTMRTSWFDTNGAWFGNGRNKWPWGDYYPQKAGWSSGAGSPECVSVMPATHPTSNIGRSFHNGVEPAATPEMTAEGYCFQEQAKRALELDPEFVLVTGWNEWTAMRFTDGAAGQMLGKPIKASDSYFVDQYNYEYSRDLEPLDGGFGDRYYYYLADFIRKYKGIPAPEVQSAGHTISIDGDMKDWEAVGAEYADDKGDTEARSHYGYGRVGTLVNTTGRNDIVLSKVATDGVNLYFYVKTDKALTASSDRNWMRLFIGIEGSSLPDWEGFHFVINNTVKDNTTTLLEKCSGGWQWNPSAELLYRVSGSEMELAVPLADLGITDPGRFAVDFKWIDNAAGNGDVQECMKNGDAAPNARFCYRYTFEK